MIAYTFKRNGRVVIVHWTNRAEAREIAEMIFAKDGK